MENEMSNQSKKCCYLYGLCDLVCFVFGSYLLLYKLQTYDK